MRQLKRSALGKAPKSARCQAPPWHKVPRLRSCHPVNGIPEPDFIGRKPRSTATSSPCVPGKHDVTSKLTYMGARGEWSPNTKKPPEVLTPGGFSVRVLFRSTRLPPSFPPQNPKPDLPTEWPPWPSLWYMTRLSLDSECQCSNPLIDHRLSPSA